MQPGAASETVVAAAIGFAGVVVTACVSAIGLFVNRQAEKRLAQEREEEENRLRLDAAMQAGKLLSGAAGETPTPEVTASGLLALTKLDQEVLAVTLFVDLWDDGRNRVSSEAAVLVIDAALRSDNPAAELVAAEVLCRNATRLNPGQSLHWPCAVEGAWNDCFSARTKLLIVEALIKMTLAGPKNESALRAVAVRLYGIWDGEDPGSVEGKRVRGCIGKLLNAVIPSLREVGYQEFVQGNRPISHNA
jgi:hypothetical protein